MKPELLEFVKGIQSNKRLNSYDEAALKQGVVLRILAELGWDPFNIDEIHPEYDVGGDKIAFSLMHNNSNKVFLEAKRVGTNLEKHQEHLLDYSAEYGVKIAVLCNGIDWWFSLPLLKRDWEEKRFHIIEIYEQDPEEIAQIFTDYLSKQNVISGKAVRDAERLSKTRQKDFLIREALPRAWNSLMHKPEEWLVDLIAEATEKLCGYRPDGEIIQDFIVTEIKAKAEVPEPPRSKAPLRPKPTGKAAPGVDYTGKSIVYFEFRGKRHDVNTWNAMLIKICEIISAAHRDRFEYVLTLAGPKRPYFSENPKELLTSEKISGTDIYVEVNIGAMSVVRLCRKILKLFGYQENDLYIEAK